jgi:hypothetical protein
MRFTKLNAARALLVLAIFLLSMSAVWAADNFTIIETPATISATSTSANVSFSLQAAINAPDVLVTSSPASASQAYVQCGNGAGGRLGVDTDKSIRADRYPQGNLRYDMRSHYCRRRISDDRRQCRRGQLVDETLEAFCRANPLPVAVVRRGRSEIRLWRPSRTGGEISELPEPGDPVQFSSRLSSRRYHLHPRLHGHGL